MYFNFDDNHPDTPRIPQPLSRREVVLIAVNIHALVLIAILLGPRLPFVREMMEQRQKAIEEQARAELERERERERERARFVFVQPRLDMTTPKVSPRADLSDKDRRAQTVRARREADNPMPFARGNSPERMEAPPHERAAEAVGAGAASRTMAENGKPPLALRRAGGARTSTRHDAPDRRARTRRRRHRRRDPQRAQVRAAGEFRQPPRRRQDQNFGESIQFDSKGVEFGPWLARFLAQVRSQLDDPAGGDVHARPRRDHASSCTRTGASPTSSCRGRRPMNAFTLSGRNAILTSNPTIPLPPEYPDDRMPITVTFFFNEYPPGR